MEKKYTILHLTGAGPQRIFSKGIKKVSMIIINKTS